MTTIISKTWKFFPYYSIKELKLRVSPADSFGTAPTTLLNLKKSRKHSLIKLWMRWMKNQDVIKNIGATTSDVLKQENIEQIMGKVYSSLGELHSECIFYRFTKNCKVPSKKK